MSRWHCSPREILPFERVSPSIDTMGTRLEVMWRLRTPDLAPAVVVAPVRALVQVNGPATAQAEPIEIRPGDIIDPTELVTQLVQIGYRREFQVEHRGEVAVRGGIVDVFGATADGPVRIDLWGDEVDRLTRFSVADQRSTEDIDFVRLFPAREVLPTDAVRARALSLMSSAPWVANSGSGSPTASSSTEWSRGFLGWSTTSGCCSI